jgi:hypothetical protein
MAVMVPHPRRRGVQQSADMLRNRATSLKLEKTILITINFTIMCTLRRRRQWGCRRQCPQPRMGRLRRFRSNRSVLWTYWHRPVARLPRRRWGRQSEHGRRGARRPFGGDWQRSICCFDGHRWTRWPNSWVLSVRGRKDFGREQEWGRKSVHNVGVNRDGGLTLDFWCGLFDAFVLREKVWGGHDVSVLLD